MKWWNMCLGRKHCGNRTKCWLPAFSPFRAMFPKASFCKVKVIKTEDCVVKGLISVLVEQFIYIHECCLTICDLL